jgi:multimeric flavodoxin WrbA
MKVIGISGSPRKDGNTEILVRESLMPFYEKGWEVTEFFLSSKTINPCMGCETCSETGTCAIEGDDMELLLSELENCDAVIMGLLRITGM